MTPGAMLSRGVDAAHRLVAFIDPRSYGSRAGRLLLLAFALQFLLSPCRPAFAQTPDPIDAALDACLATPDGYSTAGSIQCAAVAVTAWDKRLNEVYTRVMGKLDVKSRGLLQKSQRQWVAFRTAENEALGGPWREARGTIIRVLTLNADLSAVKERVQELRLYDPDD